MEAAVTLVASKVLLAEVSVNILQLGSAMLFVSECSVIDIAAAVEVICSVSECTSCDVSDF